MRGCVSLTFFSEQLQTDSGALFWRLPSLAHPVTLPLPAVYSSGQKYCIPSGAADSPHHQASRVNPKAHALSFINDEDIATSWISHVFANVTQLNQGVIISVDSENGWYQIIRDNGV